MAFSGSQPTSDQEGPFTVSYPGETETALIQRSKKAHTQLNFANTYLSPKIQKQKLREKKRKRKKKNEKRLTHSTVKRGIFS